MAIAVEKRSCVSLSDALETKPVLVIEEFHAALIDATLAAFVFVLFVPAFFVAAIGRGVARGPDLLAVRLAFLPSWWDPFSSRF